MLPLTGNYPGEAGSPAPVKTVLSDRSGSLHAVSDAVVTKAESLSLSLTEGKVVLKSARSRVAVLQQALVDQASATSRALRSALAGRVKIAEAKKTIANVRPQGEADPLRALSHELQVAMKERNAAREQAVELTLRVEALSAWTGTGPGAVLRTRHSRLAALVQHLAAELTQLEEQLRELRAAQESLTRTRTVASQPSLRWHSLEARWLRMAVYIDNLRGKQLEKTIQSLDSLTKYYVFSETGERARILEQMHSDIEAICSVFE